jgi:hypothetical protein
VQVSDKRIPGAYHANTRSKRRRKSKQDVHGGVQPLGPSVIATSRLIYPLHLLLKNSDNGAWRVAGLELGSEWMGKKIVPSAFFVRFQRIIDDSLEIG